MTTQEVLEFINSIDEEKEKKLEEISEDTIPDLYGARDLLLYYITHGDLTEKDSRVKLYKLAIASNLEADIIATTCANYEITEINEEAKKLFKTFCVLSKEKLSGILERDILKDQFTVLNGGNKE